MQIESVNVGRKTRMFASRGGYKSEHLRLVPARSLSYISSPIGLNDKDCKYALSTRPQGKLTGQ